MIDEAGLITPLAIGGGLLLGIVVLAGASGGVHYAVTTDTTPLLGVTAERGVLAVQAALRMRGVPYSWGGGGPGGPGFGIGRGARTRGFDCSGLTEYAWATAGVRIGGDTSAQWNTGARIPRGQIRPGDLIFFADNPADPATIHHVGLAIDVTRMVHAPSTGSTVRIETWAGVPYWEREFIGIIRPRHPHEDMRGHTPSSAVE
ncbi:hypothetical protein C1I98_15060 [Spongiactinospora gelatinilytica]|uniref:NlpC/P60 domain-containing protein n=1 Tax=Spongiactinospora gelatinilytica TaxID=2666298 RepID=A0A2W2H740_9ACTN|nr:C40 family peptidase [Spongiactinospora gelatinilytica]PZG45870.1 hypothetical protein C1I98_15060 [Spongiactinospora gelatinilytica]